MWVFEQLYARSLKRFMVARKIGLWSRVQIGWIDSLLKRKFVKLPFN